MNLKTIQLVGNSTGPHFLITGGVHGDEFEPIAAIHRLINLDAASLRGKLTLVPVVNEPAFLRGTRTADDDLDLARVCPGKEDGSITEQIACALSELIREADYYIDLHTGGTIMGALPFAGYTLHPDPAILENQRKMARAFNLPIIWGTHPGLNGRSLSVARDAGIPAIYAEYRGSARCSPDGITAYVNGCLNVMGMLGMIERESPPSNIKTIVEDNRPHSGHMQICHPAPVTGLFEATVELGDAVQQGDLLGTIRNIQGNECHEVHVQQTGIVLVLYTFGRVHKDTGLAVILETD